MPLRMTVSAGPTTRSGTDPRIEIDQDLVLKISTVEIDQSLIVQMAQDAWTTVRGVHDEGVQIMIDAIEATKGCLRKTALTQEVPSHVGREETDPLPVGMARQWTGTTGMTALHETEAKETKDPWTVPDRTAPQTEVALGEPTDQVMDLHRGRTYRLGATNLEEILQMTTSQAEAVGVKTVPGLSLTALRQGSLLAPGQDVRVGLSGKKM